MPIINPRMILKWRFFVQLTGVLLGAVIRVMIWYFLELLRRTSLRFWAKKKFSKKNSLLVEKVSSKILKITKCSSSFLVIVLSNAYHVHRAHRWFYDFLKLVFGFLDYIFWNFFLLRTSSWFALVTSESIKSKLLPQRPGKDPLAVQKNAISGSSSG